jgi:hypothetical protein
MKKIILGALLLLSTFGFGQITITSWNFDQGITPNSGFGSISPLNTNYDPLSYPLNTFQINGFSTPNYDTPSGTIYQMEYIYVKL